MNVILFICIISFIIFEATANDVLGCGGFIKSHVQIDFSKVEIKLYTKQGILKDRTTCAPNNGYYFIPVYDKGDYVLQLEPPPGWSFQPTKINLSVDGKTDICSLGNDVNFIFKGFGITGRVEHFGSQTGGPAGVEVELKSDKEVRTSVTKENGNFFFTPVYPGRYTVTINHPRWSIKKKTMSVTVTEGNTDLPPNSLVVAGYDVTGYVKSEDENIKGAHVILFRKDDDKTPFNVENCAKTPIENYKGNSKFICHVSSDAEGKFVFPIVSPGSYYLIPFYKGHNIYFKPSKIDFSVNSDSIVLPEIFEVTGFTVGGKILSSRNGPPVDKAVIYLNGVDHQVTKTDGSYTLDKIKTGKYKLHVTGDNMLFSEVEIKVNPNTLILPDIYPSAYKVCGEVMSDKSQVVLIKNVVNEEELIVNTDEETGMFCEYVPVGTYQVMVAVDEEDKSKNIQFYPTAQVIEVTTKAITSGIQFSQLKAELFGKVKCLNAKDCDSLKVVLRQLSNDVAQGEKDLVSDLNNGNYVFDDVRPGNYEVFLLPNRFCWQNSKLNIVVTNATYTIPDIVQNGFSITFVSSHESEVSYKTPKKESEQVTIPVSKDRSSHCLPSPGVYTFKLDGCHTYDPNSIIYDTNTEANEIYLSAVKHKHTVYIKGSKDVKDLFATVSIGGVKNVAGPLPYKDNAYVIDIFLAPNENVIIIPQSELLYFDPPIYKLTGANDCVNFGVQLKSVRGVVFKGKIIPPLAGVEVKLKAENSDTLIDITNSEGKYQFPPLDSSKTYKMTAKKDSYVLVGPNENGDFLAHKLAEIVVEVLDEVNNVPLQGALLSLSGGSSYRSNLQTNEQGKITFHSLSPSEYFLRPMLKEYNFEPNSKIIDVKEGATVHVQLRGKRVAYSAFGQVTSLNKEPEEKMIIVASGKGNCSEYSEEATSESNGNFRIRGLLPYCSYEVTIKGSVDDEEVIERATPASIEVTKVKNDIRNLHFIVFRAVPTTDVLVKVYAHNVEHYKSLRLKLSRETAPASLIHSTKLDISNVKLTDDYNSGVLVQLPSVPLDGKTYYVQLESTSSHQNILKSPVQHFIANSSFRFISLDFVVKPNSIEQQIKQTSVWTLIFIFLTLVGIYNIDFLLNLGKERFSSLNISGLTPTFKTKLSNNEYAVDTNDIDQIVESINVTKRKPKPRKT